MDNKEFISTTRRSFLPSVSPVPEPLSLLKEIEYNNDTPAFIGVFHQRT